VAHARRHAFQAEKFHASPPSSAGASIIVCQDLNPSCPMIERAMESVLGLPELRISGRSRVTVSMNPIQAAGLSAPWSAESSSPRALATVSGTYSGNWCSAIFWLSKKGVTVFKKT